MGIDLLIVLYFLVIVIVVLALVIVKDKQFLRNMWDKKEVQQEEITNLKLEKVRLKHVIRMQDETISHMLTSNVHQLKAPEHHKEAPVNGTAAKEWDLDQYETLNQEYFK